MYLQFTTPREVADLARCALCSTVLELGGGYWIAHEHDEPSQTRTRWSVWRDGEILASRHSLYQALAEANRQ